MMTMNLLDGIDMILPIFCFLSIVLSPSSNLCTRINLFMTINIYDRCFIASILLFWERFSIETRRQFISACQLVLNRHNRMPFIFSHYWAQSKGACPPFKFCFFAFISEKWFDEIIRRNAGKGIKSKLFIIKFLC